MKINFLKMSIISSIFVGILFVSCEKDELSVSETIAKNEKNIVYGPVIKVDNKLNNNGKTGNSSSRTVQTAWTNITEDDISKMGSYSNLTYAKNKFDAANEFVNDGTKPINVCVNSYQLGSSGQNPCTQFEWIAQKRFVATGTDNVASNFVGWRQVGGTSSIIQKNYFNVSKILGGGSIWTNTKTITSDWSLSVTAGITVGGKVGIPFVTEGSVQISLSATAATSGSTSDTWTTGFQSPQISVPAGKSVKFTLMERWKPKADTWNIPLKVYGFVGADYGRKVAGQYYHFVGASYYFDVFQSGAEKYTFKVNERSDHEYQVIATIVQ